jgi:hypothetical protein
LNCPAATTVRTVSAASKSFNRIRPALHNPPVWIATETDSSGSLKFNKKEDQINHKKVPTFTPPST